MTTPQAPGEIGALLRRHRAMAGLSQEELAERAGLSRRAISDLERGAHRAPYPATLRRLVQALGLTDDDAMGLLSSRYGSPVTANPCVEPTPTPTPAPAVRDPAVAKRMAVADEQGHNLPAEL